MAKTICKAKKQGIVRDRGKSSVEWHKNGIPQYYCYGYIDKTTDELLEVCRNCVDHVDHAQDDMDEWNNKSCILEEVGKMAGIRVACDFVEDTERGEYCTLNHCACDSENCEIMKNGIGREDMNQAYDALWEIMNQRR